MIRKSGWLIFLVLLACVLALVYLFAGTAIRAAMVFGLEKAVGAEVNIGKVSVSLAPLALNIEDLQVTDRNDPRHNTVSFERAQGALELWPALLGYYVINDLSVDGLAYGTLRRTPGKVFRGEHAEEKESLDLAALLRLDLPDADELMARADLQTEAKGEALKRQAREQQQTLEQLQDELPSKETLQRLETEIRALTESDIDSPADLAAKTKQLAELQDTLRAERDKLRQVQQQLEQSRSSLQQAVDELRIASSGDYERLQQLANIRDGGMAPISQILLGDFWGERIAQIEGFYRLVRPYIPESFGGNDEAAAVPSLPNRILPLPRQPYPDFWVRNARVNWLVGGGEATISLQDITGQHHIIGKPTRFDMDVQRLPQLAAFNLTGDFAVFEQMTTSLSWQLQDFSLADFALGSGSSALNIASGQLNSTGSLSLKNNLIEQQAELLLHQAAFKSTGNRYVQQLAGLLNNQSQIPLALGATGALSAPDVSVRSPLDKLIGDALLGEAKEKIASLQKDLRQQLDARLEQQLSGQNDWQGLLDQQEGEAENLEERINSMLEARLQGVASEAKDRLKDGVRDRLRR